MTQAQRQPGRFGSCYIADAAQADRLRRAAAQTKTKALQAAVAAGIGFHNAAMEQEDRELVGCCWGCCSVACLQASRRPGTQQARQPRVCRAAPSALAPHQPAAAAAQVEALFFDGALLVLCTTSTLAVGVNLPAHLVVIKGTRR